MLARVPYVNRCAGALGQVWAGRCGRGRATTITFAHDRCVGIRGQRDAVRAARLGSPRRASTCGAELTLLLRQVVHQIVEGLGKGVHALAEESVRHVPHVDPDSGQLLEQ